MSSYLLMFPGVGSSLVFSGFGLKPPAFGFQSILTVASRLLHLLLKTMGCLSGCLMFSASIQKLFCGICSAFKCSFNEFVGEKVISPSYSSAILGPPLVSILNLPFYTLLWNALPENLKATFLLCQLFPVKFCRYWL